MLKLASSIIILLFFVFRDWVCYAFFPNTKTSIGDWDASNELTMNCFSTIIFFCLLLIAVWNHEKKNYEITKYFMCCALLFSVFDLIDRFAFHIYQTTAFDKRFVIPFCFISSAIYYAHKHFKNRRVSK